MMALISVTAWWLLILWAQFIIITTQSKAKGSASGEATRIAEQTFGRSQKRDSTEHAHRQKRQFTQRRFFKYNIIYVIDSSSSIKNVDFRLSIKAIGLLTAKARPNTRYAAVMFATNARVISKFTTPNEIIKRLRAVKRMKGGTNNYAALKACRELLNNPSSGLDPKALNRIVIITDGLFNINQIKTIKEAFKLKLNNTEIFVIAVGRYLYGAPEISSLATTTDSHVFRVETMKGLVEVIQWNPYINPWESLDRVPPASLSTKQKT